LKSLRYSGGFFQEIIEISGISSENSQYFLSREFWKRLVEDRFSSYPSLVEFEAVMRRVAEKRI
jgi:hypothetical protein